ncbi:putative membrane protein [Massilia yuzhufengensis]|uniref:Putative membrane protein n=2 Tax=Massilia yuzhufengensis TaxID=1164594 RepID=A0A1I1P7P2_9BURK|nr:putative membrane protein [Massilia yuzhufengensis]
MQNNQVLKKLLAVGVLAVMFGAPGVQAQTAQPATSSGAAKLSAADKKGITDMAVANMAEVETGKLALSKSQNAEVKTFAQQMVDDHGKALADVQALAQAKGVTLPTEPDAKHKAMAAKLEKLSGDAFDKEYMKQAGLADHKATHAKLKKISKGAKDADVKAAADKTIPTVEQHLKAAQQMSMAKSGTTSGK